MAMEAARARALRPSTAKVATAKVTHPTLTVHTTCTLYMDQKYFM